MRTPVAAALAALLLPAAGLARAGEVSFLTGSATRAPAQGAPISLKVKGPVESGDLIQTGAGSRLELTLRDQSVVRLGPNSKLRLDEAAFSDSGRSFKGTLILGKAWSKVSSVLGSERDFEIRTERAVAGVRGTIFRVDAAGSQAVLVRVYAGTVAVAGVGPVLAPPPKRGERIQVPGPQQVERKQWEKIVSAMMQVKVDAAGAPGEPERFTEADEARDAWAAWNKRRDAAAP